MHFPLTKYGDSHKYFYGECHISVVKCQNSDQDYVGSNPTIGQFMCLWERPFVLSAQFWFSTEKRRHN